MSRPDDGLWYFSCNYAGLEAHFRAAARAGQPVKVTHGRQPGDKKPSKPKPKFRVVRIESDHPIGSCDYATWRR